MQIWKSKKIIVENDAFGPAEFFYEITRWLQSKLFGYKATVRTL